LKRNGEEINVIRMIIIPSPNDISLVAIPLMATIMIQIIPIINWALLIEIVIVRK